MRLLIVSPDRDIIHLIQHGYVAFAHSVCGIVSDFKKLRDTWVLTKPDVVIIDPSICSNAETFYAFCNKMRREYCSKVVVFSDDHTYDTECVSAFIPYPCTIAQFRTALNRIAREQQFHPMLVTRSRNAVVALDVLRKTLYIRDKQINLTPTENSLLHVLMENAGHVCRSQMLLEKVWGYNGEGSSHLIKAHIRHLRQKLEKHPSEPVMIVTVPGIGYEFMYPKGEETTMVSHTEAIEQDPDNSRELPVELLTVSLLKNQAMLDE